MFLTIVDKHAPLKKKRVKIVNQPEWITEEILNKIAERDHYKEIGDEDNCRLTRNSVTNIIELSKTEYYTTLAATNHGYIKKTLELLKEISSKMCLRCLIQVY